MWQQLIWEDRKKHVPPTGVPWAELVPKTALHGDPALYHHDFRSLEARREIETRCVMIGTMFKEVSSAKRCYFMNVGRVVGASCGEETCYVYAEWASGGAVHGRPITEGELRKKGIRL